MWPVEPKSVAQVSNPLPLLAWRRLARSCAAEDAKRGEEAPAKLQCCFGAMNAPDVIALQRSWLSLRLQSASIFMEQYAPVAIFRSICCRVLRVGRLGGGRHGLWQAGAAYVAAIALLFQALLFPAGCVTGAQDSPDASFGSLAGTWICTAQHGDDGKAQHPGGSKSGHDNGACCLSAACCAAILAVASAAIDLAPSSKQIFVPESWRVPAGTATPAPRNRGPPSVLLA